MYFKQVSNVAVLGKFENFKLIITFVMSENQ